MPVFTPILAHGALGVFDELLLIGVIAAFVVIMAISYVRSRNAPDETALPPSDAASPDVTRETPDRYRLD